MEFLSKHVLFKIFLLLLAESLQALAEKPNIII